MRELLVRTMSGAVLVAVVIGAIWISPWTCAALGLLIVAGGSYEMGRLQQIERFSHWLFGVLMALCSFCIAALVGLHTLSESWLFLELLFPLFPLLLSLFSVTRDFKHLSAFAYGSMALLSLPCAMMVFMYHKELFADLSGPRLLLLVFALLWVNDTFAYLTGRLLGRHKLFARVSPGKTIEGSLGGLLFTLAGVALLSHYCPWLSMKNALGMGVIAVVFGTLGDLCESMLKRQAGVKDSGNLIPGHGGVLDRFDSVLFAIPFIFVFLLLL